MEDAEKFDLETKGLSLIDFSSENDNLIFSLSSPPPSEERISSGNQKEPKHFEALGGMDSENEGNASQNYNEIEQLPELADSEEPIIRRSGKINLRKSLAWDNAFFTSAGVLDPEELSSMMKGGGEKSEKHFLTGIQEYIQQSTDSVSTLESNDFNLESVEGELFEDIRASIQKSNISVNNSAGKKVTEMTRSPDIASQKGVVKPEDQLKPKPVSKKVTGTSKCQPKISTRMQGLGKAVKPESNLSQVQRSAVRIAESVSSVLKPPKGISRASSTTPSATKVTSLGSNRVKSENDTAKTVAGRGKTSKASIPRGACRILPEPASTSKSSREPSIMTTTQSTRPSSKSASSGSLSSENERKSPLATARRKAATTAPNPQSSSSAAQTSSKNALRNKPTAKNSALSAYLMSSKLSPSISPASSLSEWSSASSSSSSAVNQRSNRTRSSAGSGSCRSLDNDTPLLDPKTCTGNQTPDGQEDMGTVFVEVHNRKPSVQAGALGKPTGLRMPSPKIGFFDGVKSVRTSNGAMTPQGSLAVALSKTGCGMSPRGSTNTGHKVGKLPPGSVSSAKKAESPTPD